MKFIVIIGIGLMLVSCEQEIGRLNLLDSNSAEITFELEKDRVVNLYTTMDIEYKEKPLFVYDFEFYKGEKYLLKGGTDPLITTNKKDELLTVKDGITHWKYYGKLDGNFIPKSDGVYTFKITFIKNNKPNLKINKAEIVFVK